MGGKGERPYLPAKLAPPAECAPGKAGAKEHRALLATDSDEREAAAAARAARMAGRAEKYNNAVCPTLAICHAGLACPLYRPIGT